MKREGCLSKFIHAAAKGKVFLVHAMEVYRGCRGFAPLILNLGTMCRRVVNFMRRLLYRRERTAIPTG
jgi:hypothetical protein